MTEHARVNRRSFFLVFVALIVLGGLSYGLSFVRLGALSVPVALSISVIKVSLVAVFFMELVAEQFVNRFVVVAALVMLSTLIVLMAADVLTRGKPPMLPPPLAAGAP
jgi:cytochrome c oxidase subunit IV